MAANTTWTSSTIISLTGAEIPEKPAGHINGAPRDFGGHRSSSLAVEIDESDMARAGLFEINIINPPPRGRSNSVTFTVTED
jgi:hypothetical protein